MPDKLKVQLITLLAATEERVAAARRRDDREREREALSELSDVKIALGRPDDTARESVATITLEKRLACTILSLLRHRDADKSICPSEVARVVESPEAWREIMPATRAVAVKMATDKVLTITRGDTVLDPAQLGKGPIRLRRGVMF